MLSIILVIAAALVTIASVIAALFATWDSLTAVLDWASNFTQALYMFIPDWLLPLATVMLVLSFAGLAVKLL